MPYIYLIHTRASLNINESVYKIGKTNDFSKRISGYDKGSIPILIIYVNNSDIFEKLIIETFKIYFIKRTDYGNEYFEGNVSDMICIIMDKFKELNMCYNIEQLNKELEQKEKLEQGLKLELEQKLKLELQQKQEQKLKLEQEQKLKLELEQKLKYESELKLEKTNNFKCNICKYLTSNKKDYKKHLETIKHQNLANPKNNPPKPPNYTCTCGNSYKHRQSLYNHHIKCTNHKSENNDDKPITNELVLQLIQQSRQLQEMYHTQNDKFYEIIKEGKCITNSNN
jgi:hypothetical protein